jgi:hypothetical protein
MQSYCSLSVQPLIENRRRQPSYPESVIAAGNCFILRSIARFPADVQRPAKRRLTFLF